MSAATRKLALLVLLVAALALYVYQGQAGPTWSGLGMAVFLVLIWTPVKGVIYRRLEGGRPYESALAANASSELAGLPFHLSLSFWPLTGTSFLVSAAIETVALLAIGTAASFRRSLFLGLYGSLVAHLLTVGWFASHQSLSLPPSRDEMNPG